MSITRKFERGGPSIWFVVTMDATGKVTKLEEHDWREGGGVDRDAGRTLGQTFLDHVARRWTDGAVAREEAKAFLAGMVKEVSR